ncbi:MAG: hypothetical protein M1322_00050 [Candidatus Parvarchaeota archaeon]|jgi:hypothetical protein|nr:hypothetical protein [Candidatus Parvarchaeota archaeon]MCL5106506.1 hypothetical protein [Candidatus Parvarchaeota archaeon]
MDVDKTCSICGRKAVFYSSYLKQDLCKKHFERMLIKRVRANMNSHNLKDTLFRLGKENKCGNAFLEFMFKDMESAGGSRLCSYTLEDFAVCVMSFFLFHDPPDKNINGKEGFSPLFNVSENEIISFFKLKKITLQPITRNEKDEAVLKFLREIEERRPGGMISLVKVGMTLNII